METLDVIVVGAGLSGIGMAWHLQTLASGKSFTILEARERLGGTWDLFRYPGIRSDSDMFTLGYAFKPWTHEKAIADGPTILSYVQETAAEHGIDRRIRYGHRVVAADWSSADALWTLTVRRDDTEERLRCRFLYMAAGYYDYERGHAPAFPGAERFGGRIVHPQFWPDDLDYAGKRVVVIGSGATAVTLVPEMAKTAASVTMLQRSPTYIVAQPSRDALAVAARKLLPAKMAYAATRWRKILLGRLFYRLARSRPQKVRTKLLGWVRDHLGPDYDVDRHFAPSYNPWDQRVCVVPDADLFTAIKAGRAEVVTDTIETVTPAGIRLASGRELEADVIVTATGLELKLIGGVRLSLDGRAVDPAQSLTYKGMMLSDIPNLALAFGYTNASWTLKADLTSAYVCRLLKRMDREGWTSATPRIGGAVEREAFLDFTSGYVQRAAHVLPKQGKAAPWRLHNDYLRDLLALRHGSVTEAMEFR